MKVALLLIISTWLHAAHAEDSSLGSLFESHSPLTLEMVGDFQTHNPPASSLTEWQSLQRFKGSVLLSSTNGLQEAFEAEFQGRGHSRRVLCKDLPPFKIRFKSLDYDLKFVPHCRNSPSAREAVLQEYTLYRILDSLGLPVFRVRLANVLYRTPSGEALAAGTGFFLEHRGTLEGRLNQRAAQAPRLISIQGILELSEFLVRNRDYGIEHNIEKIHDSRTKDVIAWIPYDFDLSEHIVGEDYVRNEGVNWDPKVKIPMLLKHYPDLRPTLSQIVQRRSELIQTISNSPMSESNRRKYLVRFEEALNEIEAIIDVNVAP